MNKAKSGVLVVLVAAGLVLGAVGGSAFMFFYLESRPVPVIPATVECPTDPALLESMSDVKKSGAATLEELNSVRLQVAEINQRAGEDQTLSMDLELRRVLPPPYVEQVDNFFLTPAARNLLSTSVQANQNLRFGVPRFIYSDTISVPYATKGGEHYLMARITVLDYYNLQFDVIWDSIESK